MYPPVEASSDEEQYYIRSTWHLQPDISRSDVPPSRGIWWPRLALSSNGWWVQIFVICFSTIGEVSHTLQCRRMSTVIQFLLVLENWPGPLCKVILLLLLFLLLLLCNFVVATTSILHMKNKNNKNKKINLHTFSVQWSIT